MNSSKKKKSNMIIQDKIYYVISYILLIIVFILVAYPLYFVIIASVSEPNAINNGEVIMRIKGFNIIGYKTILKSRMIWTGYRNSLVYMGIGTVVNLIITLPAAYALSRKNLIGRKIIMLMFTLTMFFRGGLVPTYLLVRKLHLYDTFWVMILISALSVYNLIIAKTFFQTTVSQEIIDAAKIDGCNETRCFISVILPVSKAIIAVIGLFYAVGHWNSYFNALIFLQNQELFPLQLVLKKILLKTNAIIALMPQNSREAIEEQQKIAQSLKYGVIIVASLPILMIYPFVQKYFVQGVMIGSVKG
ncbi:carbohydrate ABC transporter permease [Vallitalea sp.]|jgi:putative aldouronate transport system permease protein|uniref:carbohydrate ABC transporter permease n=1 Tax=Vallitalea sp. TaxID=1882829 RepID=UPI0025E70B16|nr:carbohydrate ABC transporter permease [Vallitalea sp.]MCT4687662.1 carbohydrate ABC transporter permease [Vallitalea sp.]